MNYSTLTIINFCYFLCQISLAKSQGEPLYLTPYIRDQRLEEGRNASYVNLTKYGHGNITSHSGYLTVDESFDSNLFFWYFPSFEQPETAPLMLWLQGGPGNSSLFGLFEEMGPFFVNDDISISFRPKTWVRNISIIYIDNPVGSGYSFTSNGYVQNQTIIGEHLYEALIQFLTLFPDLQKRAFYISGESYAGKYVPALAQTITRNNPNANVKINLQGLSLGNAFCDPPNMLLHSDLLYGVGLIDSNGREEMEAFRDQILEAVRNEQWTLAAQGFLEFFGSTTTPTLYSNLTGFNFYYNFLEVNDETYNYRKLAIESNDFREVVHVGSTPFDDANVIKYLIEDVMQSVAPIVDELLPQLPILVYNGQLDISVAYLSTINFLGKLNYSTANNYSRTARSKWYAGNDLAGYVKESGNLTEVLVRNSGHMVPRDQLDWSFDLISKFLNKVSFVN